GCLDPVGAHRRIRPEDVREPGRGERIDLGSRRCGQPAGARLELPTSDLSALARLPVRAQSDTETAGSLCHLRDVAMQRREVDQHRGSGELLDRAADEGGQVGHSHRVSKSGGWIHPWVSGNSRRTSNWEYDTWRVSGSAASAYSVNGSSALVSLRNRT